MRKPPHVGVGQLLKAAALWNEPPHDSIPVFVGSALPTAVQVSVIFARSTTNILIPKESTRGSQKYFRYFDLFQISFAMQALLLYNTRYRNSIIH
jgi:hypothetical protein